MSINRSVIVGIEILLAARKIEKDKELLYSHEDP